MEVQTTARVSIYQGKRDTGIKAADGVRLGEPLRSLPYMATAKCTGGNRPGRPRLFDDRLEVRLPHEATQKLRAIAKAVGVPTSEMMRFVIYSFIDEMERKVPTTGEE